MTPLDHLRVVRRRWPMVAGTVLVALAVAFVTAPDGATAYEATHVIGRVPVVASGDAAPDLEAGADDLLADGEVVGRAAALLNGEGSVRDVAEAAVATAGPERDQIVVAAVAANRADAVAMADAFGEALAVELDEREAARATAAAEDAAAEDAAMRARLDELRIELVGAGRDAPEVQEEIDVLAGRLGTDPAPSGDPTVAHESVRTAGEAVAVDRPVAGGTRTQRMVLAGVVALLVAAGGALMRERAGKRMATRAQVERRFGVPVLVEVPRLPPRDSHRGAVLGFHRHAGVAAAYRRLRVAVARALARAPSGEAGEAGADGATGESVGGRVVVVASPEHGDGRSATAANLAIACAEAGEKTLLVQADLVHPLPAGVLGAREAPGVADFVDDDETPLGGLVQATDETGLGLVAAGAVDHEDGGPTGAERSLLDAARRHGEVVVVDTAPLLTSALTRRLVALADVVVLTCMADGTAAPAAVRCAELLDRLDVDPVGLVLVGAAGSDDGPDLVDRLGTLLRPEHASPA